VEDICFILDKATVRHGMQAFRSFQMEHALAWIEGDEEETVIDIARLGTFQYEPMRVMVQYYEALTRLKAARRAMD
jgi:hypothetical protein